jgi:sugar lactone lactonase YvrE
MPLSQVLIAGEGWQPVGRGFQTITALAADAKGNLWIADAKRVVRLGPDGGETLVAGAGVRGLSLAGTRIYLGFDGDDGHIESLDAQKNDAAWGTKGIKVQNLAVTRGGTIYCTVLEQKAVFRVAANGEKTKIAEGIAQPAGIALWQDQGTLVVADAAGKHLYAYRIEKDGSLTCKEGYYTLRLPDGQKESGAGGMTVDSAGRLYVASTVGVQCFDPTGRLNGVLLNPTSTPSTAVAFGGPEGSRLYIACGDRLFTRKTKAKGIFPDK